MEVRRAGLAGLPLRQHSITQITEDSARATKEIDSDVEFFFLCLTIRIADGMILFIVTNGSDDGMSEIRKRKSVG